MSKVEILVHDGDLRQMLRSIAELEEEIRDARKHQRKEPGYDIAVLLQYLERRRAALLETIRASWRVVENPILEMLA